MTGRQLIEMFDYCRQPFHLVGTEENGVIVGLSLEGRFFTILDGEVISRVNPEAFTRQSSMECYINPGGDGLWPAPEGSVFGYEYPTEAWRVPPGITGARYRVVSEGRNSAAVTAEIDLINSRGTGISAIFGRSLEIKREAGFLEARSLESIEYIGSRTLGMDTCMIGPWSLCQFDCRKGCEVIVPQSSKEDVWDLYAPSDDYRRFENGSWRIRTEGDSRFQVGISPRVEWIEYRDPSRGIAVRRTAGPIGEGFIHFDISDRPPGEEPGDMPVKYSVYNDGAGFMEIEAAGGTAREWRKNTSSRISVTTIFRRMKEAKPGEA